MAMRYCDDGDVGAYAPSPFYGCYLLLSKSPRFRGCTYIGFTVDPQRRLQQHNAGRDKGGAWRTSGRGPWELVCMVYGFMDEISALQFEWAWQNPSSTRRLRSLPREARERSKGATAVENRVRTMAALLGVGPFCRLPLTLHWVSEEARARCARWTERLPGLVRVRYGPISVKPKKRGAASQPHTPATPCAVCYAEIANDTPTARCYADGCGAQSHVPCLAKCFLSAPGCEDLCLPVGGRCPACNTRVLWGEMLRPLTAAGMPFDCSARRKAKRGAGGNAGERDDDGADDDGYGDMGTGGGAADDDYGDPDAGVVGGYGEEGDGVSEDADGRANAWRGHEGQWGAESDPWDIVIE